MSSYPKISVITPSYNQGEFLEETICSVLNQKYPNLEYIIIDGGSTDNSVDIIKKYEKQLAYWVSEKDGGMYYAIQKGMERATGEIMTWINSDDLLSPKSLFWVADLFERYKQIEWLGGSVCLMDEESNIVYTMGQKQRNRFSYYLKDYKYVQQEGTFWRRGLWEKAGAHISTDYKLAGDLELWLRFFQHADYYILNAPLGRFRMRKAEQKSLEGRDAYHEEAEQAIDSFPISRGDKAVLKRFNFYTTFFSKIPVVGEMHFFKQRLTWPVYRYPASFRFDQVDQRFEMLPYK
jgi:glycosyltransferase involved in cell wall biosynthesis